MLWFNCVCGCSAKCVGKIGTVHRITDRGDIRVQYDGANNRWTFHALSLTKVRIDVFVLYDQFVSVILLLCCEIDSCRFH